VPVGGLGEGWQHSTSALATVIIRFLLIVFEQRLLPRPGNQLFGVQGSVKLASGTIQPVPLLPNAKRQLLRTTYRSKANNTTQPYALIVTVVTSFFVVPDPVGNLATSGNPTEQLHAIIRPNTRRKEAVHSVLGFSHSTACWFPSLIHRSHDGRTSTCSASIIAHPCVYIRLGASDG
jgi:hypothetical protein